MANNRNTIRRINHIIIILRRSTVNNNPTRRRSNSRAFFYIFIICAHFVLFMANVAAISRYIALDRVSSLTMNTKRKKTP